MLNKRFQAAMERLHFQGAAFVMRCCPPKIAIAYKTQQMIGKKG
jgi:hypothetical protein